MYYKSGRQANIGRDLGGGKNSEKRWEKEEKWAIWEKRECVTP